MFFACEYVYVCTDNVFCVQFTFSRDDTVTSDQNFSADIAFSVTFNTVKARRCMKKKNCPHTIENIKFSLCLLFHSRHILFRWQGLFVGINIV